MDLLEHKKRFYASVLPARPNSWDVDEIFELLAELDETKVEALLAHVGAIWPVSHSLCFSYLTNGAQALEQFPQEMLGEWVRQILGLYERKGLLGARHFMADVDRFFLGPMRGVAGVAFEEIASRMVHYLRGISGRSFELAVARLPSTDTATIFLPEFLDTFPDKQNNIFLYKLLISLQWQQVESRIFSQVLTADTDAPQLFARYPDRQLAVDLFAAIRFIQVLHSLELELPGLIRQGRELCLSLIKKIVPRGGEREKSIALQNLLMQGIASLSPTSWSTHQAPGVDWKNADYLFHADPFDALAELYNIFSGLSGSYTLGPAALLLGEFDFTRAGEIIRLRRADDKEKFVAMFAVFLEQQKQRQKEEEVGGNVPDSSEENLLLLIQKSQKEEDSRQQDANDAILLENEGLEVPAELAALIKGIEDDLGALPEAYVQAAAGQAGRGVQRKENDSSDEQNHFAPRDGHKYDEWDYRRAGYRKDWCTLTEKSLHPVRSGFVAGALAKYQAQLNRLRRQFEMLRSRERFVRRRRHGDDIDLDALIEALGDSSAGLSPSDRLFIQLLRDERDIAAMFLVDMSNSTEGWVGVAVKESLVLLAEALEVVGDRYGIYGFSGMRRSGSELFHIKHLDEPYGAEVQGRIAAIGPKEYTRMGPPIRHLTKILQETQSTVRLLVVISDGKPEDYDDYKGQYAIEDTRKALLEARGCGVHSFCITIDKAAHDYLTHMFGKGNYVFVNNVLALPAKMVEMYRLLTS
jgi:nitric oxide reductase NorD protein